MRSLYDVRTFVFLKVYPTEEYDSFVRLYDIYLFNTY